MERRYDHFLTYNKTIRGGLGGLRTSTNWPGELARRGRKLEYADEVYPWKKYS